MEFGKIIGMVRSDFESGDANRDALFAYSTIPKNLADTMSNNFKLWVINKLNMKITYAVFLLLITFAQAIEFTLSYVHFIDETATIDPKSYPYLDSHALFLEKINAKVEIGWYTDNVGTPAAKIKLSEERAKAIYDYLVSNT